MINNSSKIYYPTNRNILIKLYKKTNNKDINWYLIRSNKNIETWKSSEKITTNKSILYTIYHNIDKPQNSYIVFHIEKRYYYKDILKSETKLARTISEPYLVILLLKKAIQNSGKKIVNYFNCVVQQSNNDDKILLVKYDKISNWVLPGEFDSNWKLGIKSKCNKIGIVPKQLNRMKYKNIIKYDDIYYYVTLVVIEKYSGNIGINDFSMWFDVSLNDFYYRMPLGPETKRIINYYLNNNLPF
jgi:hypothetical protein